jgi:DNA methylase
MADGWGTALRPAHEPICVARKPLSEPTVAANVLRHGTGGINVDACRVGGAWVNPSSGQGAGYEAHNKPGRKYGDGLGGVVAETHPAGRWPSNVAFVHNAGCRPVGTRRVSGGFRSQNDLGEYRNRNAVYGRGVGNIQPGYRPGYADPDGTETVTAWRCEPDCAVRLLDESSGESQSSDRVRTTCIASRGGIMNAVPSPSPRQSHGFSDRGGASRFFPTFAYGEADGVEVGEVDAENAEEAADSSTPVEQMGLFGGSAPAPDARRDPPAQPPPAPAAPRVLYTSKAPTAERNRGLGGRNRHITVKPVSLLFWLLRMVCAPGATVIDPFAGSGTTGVAAEGLGLGLTCILIERDPEWVETARGRIGMFAEVRRLPEPGG